MSALPSLKPARQATSALDGSVKKHLDDLRRRVAVGIAQRTIKDAEVVDEAKVGVALTLAYYDSERLLWRIVDELKMTLKGQRFLFAAARGPPHHKCWPVMFISSSSELLHQAVLLTSTKFFGRVKNVHTGVYCWTADIDDVGTAARDVCGLWDIVRRASRGLPSQEPPYGSRTINELVAAAQTRLDRVSPERAYEAWRSISTPFPVVLIDIRSINQRKIHGSIPDAIIVDRCLLEWKLDPTSKTRLNFAHRYDTWIILIDQDGLASSLAAISLHDLGLQNATDVVGGFRAWKAAGLPTVPPF